MSYELTMEVGAYAAVYDVGFLHATGYSCKIRVSPVHRHNSCTYQSTNYNVPCSI